MNSGPKSWQRFAEASRARSQEAPGESAQRAEPIPWLSGFPEQVHAVFVQLAWKRWAAVAIIASVVLLAVMLLKQSPGGTADSAPPSPRIPVPVAP